MDEVLLAPGRAASSVAEQNQSAHFLCQMRSSVVEPSATATRPMATPAVSVEKNFATVRPVYPARRDRLVSAEIPHAGRRSAVTPMIMAV